MLATAEKTDRRWPRAWRGDACRVTGAALHRILHFSPKAKNGMSAQRITEIVIVGGGTAGWMTAAALSRLLTPDYSIRVVESEEIGRIGVGEATIPMIKLFNGALGLEEGEFVRRTKGTFKLGIDFRDGGRVGHRYVHGFGSVGQDLGVVPFHQYWLKLRRAGGDAPLSAYSIAAHAGLAGKFMHAMPDRAESPMATIAYAYQFDAALYADILRDYAQARGVQRIEGLITCARQHAETGLLESVALQDGREVAGQLFIDCSGFRALLIEQTLHAGYEDWTHWLPCDSAVAVPCQSPPGNIEPFTRATARDAGWQWRIPLQHRVGNGHVFCSRYVGEDEATATLLANLDGEPLAEPRLLRFNTGKRRRAWIGNVVAIGLSSGFMEPLESTSIHLIQSAIARLIALFPGTDFNAADINAYNMQNDQEMEKIRDFLIAHYHITQRDDTAFWRDCKHMAAVPDSLQHKMEVFRSHGRIFRDGNELFAEPAWLQVMHGQLLEPAAHHPLTDAYPQERIAAHLAGVRDVIARCVDAMPTHSDYLARVCDAGHAAA